jgi:hypothetical protein
VGACRVAGGDAGDRGPDSCPDVGAALRHAAALIGNGKRGLHCVFRRCY